MNYKTILVHVDNGDHAATRIAVAAALAQQFGAHLVGAATTGVSRFFYQEGAADLARTVLAPYMDTLFRKTAQALERFGQLAAAAGPASWEKRLIDDEAGAGLALAARYADLLVLGQAEPGAPSAQAGGDLAPWILLACPRPLLVVPYVQGDAGVGRRVLLAWNGSVQAVRAMTAALPLLRRADAVTVAMFGSPGEALEPDPLLLPYLARHGVDAQLVHAATELDVGDALLSLAADRDADLLVMGGYGHSRLGELVLGGATRTILQTMTLPVLLAH